MASDTRAVERAIPALLHQRYGIEAKAIAPAPGGEIGMAFVETADGARWFVKASLPQSWYSRLLESLKGALNASAAIKPQVMPAEVVAPLRSIDGDRVVLSDSWRISVFPFVDAKPIGRRQDWPDEVLNPSPAPWASSSRVQVPFGVTTSTATTSSSGITVR